MLNVIPIEITKKIAIEYIQKERRNKFKLFTKKIQLNTQQENKIVMQEMRDKVAITHIKTKDKVAKVSPSFINN